MAIVVGCTASAPPDRGSEGRPSPTEASPQEDARPALALAVVASVTGPTSELDGTFLAGMRLAVRELEREGVAGKHLRLDVLDDGGRSGRAADLLARVLEAGRAKAVLVAGPGAPVAGLRREVEAVGVPVVLLGGDLYSSRRLFGQVFQTGVPVVWQARVLAKYLVRDRRHRRVLLITEPGPDERTVRAAFAGAMAEEGAAPTATASLRPGEGAGRVAASARRMDAVVFLGGPEGAGRVASTLQRLPRPPQLGVSVAGLSPLFASAPPAPGTVAPYAYTWAGWAKPIPRVGRFRERMRDAAGTLPAGMEQEGYDAVRLLADALERTGGAGGRRLVRAIEDLPDRAYSSLPVKLGPDDHIFLGQHELGLFAVPGPGERVERWVVPQAPWRPVMRTFTADGERTSILDRDRRVFFPFWRKLRPGPKYWRSRWGIVTRPGRDPRH